MSRRLVAASTTTPSLAAKPSISTSSWLSVCSRSSWPPPRPAPLWRPTASISSMEHHRRGHLLGLGKEVPDAAGATPTYSSTKSEPEMERNCTPASPATALASSVLPVARRAHQQHALGDAGPQVQVLLGLPEEADDLRQLLLLLVGAGHIVEGDLLVLLRAEADAGLAELHALVHAAPLGPGHHELPEQEQRGDQQPVEQDAAPPGRLIGRVQIVVQDDAVPVLLVDDVPQVLVKTAPRCRCRSARSAARS